jgi:hypothetical protein
MDWKQFFAAILVGFAWPAVFITLLVILRKQIPALFERIEEASFGGGKLRFDKAIDAARAQVDKIDPEVKAAQVKRVAEPNDPFYELAINFPEAAILEAWRHVEETLTEMVPYLGLPTKGRDPYSVLMALVQEKCVDGATLKLFENLWAARNTAAHGARRPSPGDALEFRTQAQSLIEILRKAFDRWQRDPANADRPFPNHSNKPTLAEKRDAQSKQS